VSTLILYYFVGKFMYVRMILECRELLERKFDFVLLCNCFYDF